MMVKIQTSRLPAARDAYSDITTGAYPALDSTRCSTSCGALCQQRGSIEDTYRGYYTRRGLFLLLIPPAGRRIKKLC
jgi:hypothetical protein